MKWQGKKEGKEYWMKIEKMALRKESDDVMLTNIPLMMELQEQESMNNTGTPEAIR